jgi:hypothetical protein
VHNVISREAGKAEKNVKKGVYVKIQGVRGVLFEGKIQR